MFHVGQVQAFCRDEFEFWDPKITTPPGLYHITVAIQKLSLAIGLDFACNLGFVRSINTVLAIFLYQVIRGLLTEIRDVQPWLIGQDKRELIKSVAIERLWQSLTLVMFPVSFTFIFLYYTDIGSTLMVLWAYLQALRGRHVPAAIIGAVSLYFRQTNIVWVIFAGGVGSLVELAKAGNVKIGMSLEDAMSDPVEFVKEAVKILDANRWILLTTLIPYATVLGSFLRFIVINGGITLGDKSNHQAGLNVPQLWHFMAFATFFSLPTIMTNSTQVFSRVKKLTTGKALWSWIFLAVVMLASIHFLTYTHPFLLADNRHYSFVVWRWLMRISPFPRYIAVGLYVVATVLLLATLLKSSVVFVIGFFIATSLVLIPSPLLEFRYFIVPYLLLRLHSPPSSMQSIAAEGIFYTFINIFVMYRLLYRPFEWINEPGKLQRFIW